MAQRRDESDLSGKELKNEVLEEFEKSESGARAPGLLTSKFLFVICLAWAAFQIYIATPLPFMLKFMVLDEGVQRSIHLAFALLLLFCYYPLSSRASTDRVPIYDWVLALTGVATCMYILFFYEDVVGRSGGARTGVEIAVAVVGILVLMEATRRVIGLPLVIVCVIFFGYSFFGYMMPDIISHRGISINKFTEHMWLSSEGVFGLPIGVSNTFLFLYVLFGTLLGAAGAGGYFIRMAFSLLGHLTGGPAKAAVLSSAMFGMISGSAIANMVTIGTFTIPLMKRVGFSPEKAAAVEVSSSINGQIMPPVMGAAAFIMTEFVGIPYSDVVKHAFIPAILAYFGLYCVVHIEARKINMQTLKRTAERPLGLRLARTLMGVLGVTISGFTIYVLFTYVKVLFGSYSAIFVICILSAAYLYLLKLSARYQDPDADRKILETMRMPALFPTLMGGLYYLIPVGVLIWCLMVERWSPELSCIWGIAALVIQMLTEKPLIRLMQGHKIGPADFRVVFKDLLVAMYQGSRNMITVVIAMASAGIIVGVVSATGLGVQMCEVVQRLSGNNVLFMLLATAGLSIMLGMGLPTTANYIVVSSLMANPLVVLAAQNGIPIPLIGVHLFCFYYGLISGTTPPVAVDAYAGAAVAHSDPIKTCLQAFVYDLRTSMLPLMFVFNPALLLIGINHWWEGVLTFLMGALAMLSFASATLRFLRVRSHLWESVALLLIAFSLLRPGFWLNLIQAPYYPVPLSTLEQVVAKEPDDALLLLSAKGENRSGETVTRNVLSPLGKKGVATDKRLSDNTGLSITAKEDKLFVSGVRPKSNAETAGVGIGWEILKAELQADRISKYWLYIPPLALFCLIFFIQTRRKDETNSIHIQQNRVSPGA